MNTLYVHTQKRQEDQMIFMAALQGIDLKKAGVIVDDEKPSEKKEMKISEEAWFKDPSEYAHMSDEEKEKETQKMMSTLKKMTGKPKTPRTYFAGMGF
jgi:hypothetical protein